MLRKILRRLLGLPSGARCRLILGAVLWALADAHAAGARQAVRADPRCERLLRLVATAPDSALATRDLHACGPTGVAALADLVRGAATRSDGAYLSLLHLAATESSIRPVLEAAAELAQNRGASVPSRLTGLHILVQQVYGRDSYLSAPEDLARYELGARVPCGIALRGGEQVSGGIATLQQIAKHLSDDRSEPTPLRLLGLCIMREYQVGYALAEDVSRIHVTAVCADRYRVKSEIDHPIRFRWEVVGSTAHGRFDLPTRGEVLFFTDRTGITRFYSADELIAAVPSSPKVCTVEP